MRLAVPMPIISNVGHLTCREAKGVCRDVGLALLADQVAAIGDHVLVRVGYAIQAIMAACARSTWDLSDEFSTALDHAGA